MGDTHFLQTCHLLLNRNALYTFLFILHKNVFILATLSNWFKSFFTLTKQFYERKTHLFYCKVSVFLEDEHTK